MNDRSRLLHEDTATVAAEITARNDPDAPETPSSDPETLAMEETWRQLGQNVGAIVERLLMLSKILER
jgi:hypothetical protein